MQLTCYNAPILLGGDPTKLQNVLPRVFEQLVSPTIDTETLLIYCRDLSQRFMRDIEVFPPDHAMDAFGRAALNAGLIKTLVTISKSTRLEPNCGAAIYFSLECLSRISQAAGIQERHEVLDKFMEQNFVDTLLDFSLSHRYFICRSASVETLRTLVSENFLGSRLTPQKTCDVIMTLCRFILAGPETFKDQVANPALAWQILLCRGDIPSITVATRYAPRFFGMCTEKAIWSAHGILCRDPPPTQEFCLELIQHKPEVLDLLFQCAVLKRQPWYPDCISDSVACEILTVLIRGSFNSITGIPLTASASNEMKAQENNEHQALLKTWKIVRSRPNWVRKILAVWKHLEDENFEQIANKFSQLPSYYPANAPKPEEIIQIFEARGTSRISMLKLISLLAVCAQDDDSVSTADLLSFLKLAYTASLPRKPQSRGDDPPDFRLLEHHYGVCRFPYYCGFLGIEMVDPPGKLHDEVVSGPLALLHLLIALSKRGLLSSHTEASDSGNTIPVEKWDALPQGTTDIALNQVKQITSPPVIAKVLGHTFKQLANRREQGHNALKKPGGPSVALVDYMAGAEVAMAIIHLTRSLPKAQKDYMAMTKGVRKELVLCLGNASEMALRGNWLYKALMYAMSAVEWSDGMPKDDSVDAGVIAKNRRRVERAMNGDD